jgi:hypothetical protein
LPPPLLLFARVLPIRVGDVIFFIFGRRLWRCSVLTPLLRFEQLKEAKKKCQKNRKKKFHEIARTNSISKRNNPGKLGTGDVLNDFPPAGKPKLPCKFSLDSEDVFVRSKSRSARSIRKMWKFFAKLWKIGAVKIVKQLQNTLD